MKYCQIFVLVIALVFSDQTHSLFLHGGQISGNLTVSGNFDGLLKNHPWIAAPKETQDEEILDDYLPSSTISTTTETTTTPVTTTTTTTTTTEATTSSTECTSQIPVSNEIVVTGHIDLNQVAGDAIGRHIQILQHIQRGISSRIDNHVQRLGRFENYIQNHFNKVSSAKGSLTIRKEYNFGVTSE